MPKLVLDMSAMKDDFFSDSALIGLGTAQPAYHLCWLINNQLETRFARDPEQTISLKKKSNEFAFPVFAYYLPNSEHKHLLYKLKNGPESLLPEARQLDYLWMIQTASAEEDALEILAGLKKMNDIQLSMILDPSDLKNITNLLV